MHNKIYNPSTVQVYLELLPTLINKINNDENLDKGCVRTEFLRDQMSQKSDLYEFKKVFFDDGKKYEFFFH